MTQTPVMEQERPITLREQELLERGQHLAEKLAVRDRMVDEKKAEAKKRQEEIDDLDAEISKLAESIRDGFENRKQGDLFVDQALPKDKAAATLAEVAKRAERHPFVASSTAIDTCAREACGVAAAAEVHVPPVPSEPHTFAPDGTGEGKCWGCGSAKDDPIHADLRLDAASEVPGTEETTSEPTTIDCSRCSKTVPKTEVLYDAGVKPVCETCKRAGVEAGTWPHPFRKGHQKSKRCADCGHQEDDAVHEAAPEAEPATTTEPVATGDPAFDFPADEPPPNIIRTHRAIDTVEHPADDGPVGGEA